MSRCSPFIFGVGCYGSGGGGGGGATLEIEVYSDAGYTIPASSFNYGATAYIKLVPTNITPTTYSFFFGNGTKNAPQVTQAGNALAWVVTLTGAVTISATATQGTTATADATPFVLTSIFVLSNSLYLDGVNDTTTARFIPQLGEDWSVTFWVKMMNIGRSNTFFEIADIFGQRPVFIIGFRQPISSISLGSWSTKWGSAGFPITADTNWHNYSITYKHSTTTLTVFLDGVALYSSAWTFNQPFTMFNIGYTGDMPYVGGNYGNIKMADLRIFSDVLTQAEVVDVMNDTSSVTPIQRYILDDGIGVASGFLTDYVSNQYLLLRGITSPFGTDADIPY